MLDVRAPIEFAQGSFPNVVNLPLMTDDERQAVGLAYKEKGQDAAIALGHSLVNGATKDARVAQWLRFTTANPTGVLYCFRGGLRSQISQQWLAQAGVNYPRLLGGYKAMRQYLITAFEENVAQTAFTVVGGLTGCGKTDVIRAIKGKLDLEGIARHRGSSFGGRAESQPTQIDFENQLSIHLLKLLDQGYQDVAIEDESNLVGRCAIPLVLRAKTQISPLVWVTAPLEERVERILRDYVIDLHDDYVDAFGQDAGRIKYQAHLTKSLYNLRKRLGLARFDELNGFLNEALNAQMSGGGFELHKRWVEPLLTQYYDPMYAYQRQQKAHKPHFEGDAQSVIAFLRQHQASR
jgi:tRNA 2-selenouridine synthase